ncbi:MAG: hypothetical protein ACOC1K_08120 [Nanoarchaeota archaeon]
MIEIIKNYIIQIDFFYIIIVFIITGIIAKIISSVKYTIKKKYYIKNIITLFSTVISFLSDSQPAKRIDKNITHIQYKKLKNENSNHIGSLPFNLSIKKDKIKRCVLNLKTLEYFDIKNNQSPKNEKLGLLLENEYKRILIFKEKNTRY